MARTKTTENLQAILPRLIETMKGKKQFQMHMVFYAWEKIVGPQIAIHVKPVRMDFRTLFLYADAPAWAAQLRYMERELIDKINAYVATELVISIRYTNYIENKKQKNMAVQQNDIRIQAVPDKEDLSRAEEFCGGMKDSEVKAAAQRAFSQREALKREQKKRSYHPCVRCGVLCPPDTDVCTVCEGKRREEKRAAVRHAIAEEPWLSYAELYERFRCTTDMAMEQRLELMRFYARRVYADDETSSDAKKIVMLCASLHPEELTEEIIHKVLSRMMYDLNYNEEAFKKKKSVKYEKKTYSKRRYERRETE